MWIAILIWFLVIAAVAAGVLLLARAESQRSILSASIPDSEEYKLAHSHEENQRASTRVVATGISIQPSSKPAPGSTQGFGVEDADFFSDEQAVVVTSQRVVEVKGIFGSRKKDSVTKPQKPEESLQSAPKKAPQQVPVSSQAQKTEEVKKVQPVQEAHKPQQGSQKKLNTGILQKSKAKAPQASVQSSGAAAHSAAVESVQALPLPPRKESDTEPAGNAKKKAASAGSRKNATKPKTTEQISTAKKSESTKKTESTKKPTASKNSTTAKKSENARKSGASVKTLEIAENSARTKKPPRTKKPAPALPQDTKSGANSSKKSAEPHQVNKAQVKKSDEK